MQKEKFATVFHLTSILLLVATMLFFWGHTYVNHLVYKEQMQMFLTDFAYLKQHLSFNGGFAMYVGEWLTQFFLLPWLAVTLMAWVFLMIYLAMAKTVEQLVGARFVALTLVPALAYALLLTDDFYYLGGAFAFGATLWMLVIYIKSEPSNYKTVMAAMQTITIYWLLGGFYLVFVASVLVVELLHHKSNRKWIFVSMMVALTALLPLLNHWLINTNTLSVSIFSPAYYKFTILFPKPLLMVMASAPITIIAYILLSKYLQKIAWQLAIVSVVAAMTVYGFITVPNHDEETEMAYSNLVYQKRWNDVVKKAEQQQPKGEQGKLALALALAQTHQLGERYFEFAPLPGDFFIRYKSQGMAPLIANEPYYYLGLVNFSQMLSMESLDSAPSAILPVRAIKRYAETCIITGQYKVAEKFLGYLERTFFYRNWALDAKQYLNNDAKVESHPEWGPLRRNQLKDPYYFSLETIDLALVYLLRSNAGNSMALDYLLTSCLVQKDMDSFLKFLPLLAEKSDKTLPKVYDEALAFAKTILPQTPESLQQLKTNPSTEKRLQQYAQAFNSGGHKQPELMVKHFGDTYWYYIHFSQTNANTTAQERPNSMR